MVTRILVNWAKAIAAYEYTLISVDSHFDEFVAAGARLHAISAAAKRGARLFVGKAACVDCHAGPQLTDELFHDIGVPQTGWPSRRPPTVRPTRRMAATASRASAARRGGRTKASSG